MASAPHPDPQLGGPFVRQDVWKLYLQGPDGQAVIDAYAKAVAVLKAGPPTGARSWLHQTQVHGMSPDPHDGLRNQCQHGSWYFLPWHRLYLGYFEAICRDIIRNRNDIPQKVKDTWALPYWDYDTATTNTLPPPFRDPIGPDGLANPLYEVQRKSGVNAGTAALAATETTAKGWFHQPLFTSKIPNTATFGGPTTGFSHLPGTIGTLEGTPHGTVHNFVGGKMGNFNTAASDAVFWLHHSNIDRLWEVWRSHTGQGRDPAKSVFTQKFAFLDPSGARREPESWEVLDTSAFGYVYADIGVPPSARTLKRERRRPVAGIGDAGGEDDARREEEVRRLEQVPPEAVAVNREPVRLASGTASVDIAVGPGAARDLTDRAASPTEPERLLLVLEHITLEGDNQPPTYAVYVGDTEDDDALVGNLPLFGVRESQEADAEHGLSYVFDITDVAAVLGERGAWDPGHLHLTFHPVVHDEQEALAAPEVVVRTVRLMVQ
ncbi:tyrosinase family protein [Oerskovia rustica]|uniref:Tyrosinase family protein n=1 Tax=Oerskovia rustica TaxID=2762237 RepID=A0ABR8RN98_9CELL|nr:tyrosinase family protein [Oerskovia rustica]MBD7949269.1 tyrosinase family protein [Oerskovia rustica]